MILKIHTFELRLKHAFTITHASRTSQPALVVELIHEGLSGLGEAAAVTYYGKDLNAMVSLLEQHRALIENTPLESPEQYWESLFPYFREDPFVLCALDVAAHDLFAQQQGLPLYERWGLSLDRLPLTNYTIGIAPVEEMVAKMNEQPWPLYKIKLGTAHDLDIVRTLRQNTDAVFRVDANTGWTAAQTIEYAPVLKDLGVELIEQPLKTNDRKGMKRVYKQTVLPVIADESCQTEEDVARCHGYFHGINIKLMKCGGLTPARRMIRKARELGMTVMVGCMTESTVGVSAIAHLLPLLDYVDMDGPLLLKEDIATGVCIDEGKVYFPRRNGIGAELV